MGRTERYCFNYLKYKQIHILVVNYTNASFSIVKASHFERLNLDPYILHQKYRLLKAYCYLIATEYSVIEFYQLESTKARLAP
jgi:hypothetical protein